MHPPVDRDKLRQFIWIERQGTVDFYHYDLYSQALAKIARGFDKDLADARHMVHEGHVDPRRLIESFEQIRPLLVRYPRLDEDALAARVRHFVETARETSDG